VLPALRRIGYGRKTMVFTHAPAHLHAMLISCGYSQETASAYDWHGLKRGKSPFVLFQYTVSGKGMLRYGPETMEVLPGHAMLLHFPHDNRYWLPKDFGPWEFIWVCMNGSEVFRLWNEFEARSGPLISCAASSTPVLLAARLYEDAMASRIVTPFDASERAYRLTMAIADAVLIRPDGAARHPGIQRAIDLCATAFARPLGIDDLARASGFSRFHFCRTFRTSEGMTPLEYLTSMRLREAAHLLEAGEFSVKEISARCGFSDPNYFCKVFRGKMHLSPGEFRKSGMYAAA